MGIIGILIAVFLAILGAGYFLFNAPGAGLIMENPAVMEQGAGNKEQGTTENRLSVATEALEEARGIKEMAEKRAEEVMEENPGSKKQGVGSKEEKQEATENSQPSIGDFQSKIKNHPVSFGYAEGSGRKIDTVVLHSSYNNQGGDRYSVEKVIDIWESYEVAPHYMIDRKGNIYRLVEDEDIAYHAGNSKMPDGRTDVNAFSIGIEILGDEDDGYTDAQYGAVNDLIDSLKRKHGVKYVVGHADIAPGRKTDPWNFDWKRLQ